MPFGGGQKGSKVRNNFLPTSETYNEYLFRFGMLAPMLVQMERQIDREIAADQKKMGGSFHDGVVNDSGIGDDESDSDMEDEEPVLMYGPVPQIVTNDLKSLDEMVSPILFS